jgi:hypothetical protein
MMKLKADEYMNFMPLKMFSIVVPSMVSDKNVGLAITDNTVQRIRATMKRFGWADLLGVACLFHNITYI